jgi:type I restriction enzyme S subunit
MKKYQSYKTESEEWIGDIPIHWIKSRVGRHFKIERGRVISKEEIQDNLGDYPVYSSQTTNNGELGRISTYDFDGEYVTWTTDGEKTGTCFYRNGKFNTTNVCGMLSIRETTPYSLKFLNYYLNQVTRPYVRLDINPKLMNNMMSEIPLLIPPLQEQLEIVQFLDEKTELIDKLISTKERKINLLKEQRTSLINQVVTKGLNPNVKMKDSGVEWIGEIPENWNFLPIKYTLQKNKDSIRTGPFGSSLKSDEFLDEGVRVYNQRSVYDEDFSKSDIFISEEKFQELKGFIVLPGDVLITSRGTIGRMTIVPVNGEVGVLHPCLIRLRLNIGVLNPNYLWWYINHSSLFINSVKIESNSTTIEVIYSETLSTIRLPLPLITEQHQIVEFLNSKTIEIDNLIGLEQKKIDLLKEYRQSLISEVVTGKIKVTTDE